MKKNHKFEAVLSVLFDFIRRTAGKHAAYAVKDAPVFRTRVSGKVG